jgi:hypothetical protein
LIDAGGAAAELLLLLMLSVVHGCGAEVFSDDVVDWGVFFLLAVPGMALTRLIYGGRKAQRYVGIQVR